LFILGSIEKSIEAKEDSEDNSLQVFGKTLDDIYFL